MEPLTTPMHIDKYHEDLKKSEEQKEFQSWPLSEYLAHNPRQEPDYKALYHFAIGWIEARAWGTEFRDALKYGMQQKEK